MSTKTETATHEWLHSLSPQQLRALGSQHKIEGWNEIPSYKLKDALSVLPDVAVQAGVLKELPETD